ncbi:MAG: hypothetical protein WC775_05480 [Patescibacteria group bacterium]|jgi:Mn2+/Fe2+ NRAMP family transporter
MSFKESFKAISRSLVPTAISEVLSTNGALLGTLALTGTARTIEAVSGTLPLFASISPAILGLSLLGSGITSWILGTTVAGSQGILETPEKSKERTLWGFVHLLAPIAIALATIGTLPAAVLPAAIGASALTTLFSTRHSIIRSRNK